MTDTLTERERSLILAHAEKELFHARYLMQRAGDTPSPDEARAIAEALSQVGRRYETLAGDE